MKKELAFKSLDLNNWIHQYRFSLLIAMFFWNLISLAQSEEATNSLIHQLHQTRSGNADSVNLITDQFIQKVLAESDPLADRNLCRAGILLTEKDQLSAALRVLRQAFQLAGKYNHPDEKIACALGLSDIFYKEMMTDSALYYTDYARAVAQKEKINKYDENIYNEFARISDLRGEHYSAIEWYLKAADIHRLKKDNFKLAIVLGNIGSLHINLKNYNQALQYLHQAESLISFKPDDVNLNDIFINMGVAYQEKGAYEKAVFYYGKSLVLSKNLHNDYQLARVFLNLSNTKLKTGNYQEAQAYLDSSRMICEKDGFAIGLLFCSINQGELLLTTGQAAKALPYLQQAEKQMMGYNIPEIRTELLRLLSLAYEMTGNSGRALTYHKEFTVLRDSVSNSETNRLILELQTRYESERTARQVDQLEEKVKQQTSRNWFFGLGFALAMAVLLLVVSWFILYHRSTKFRKRQTAEENENLLLRMEIKDQELVSKAMLMAKMNEMVLQVSSRLRTVLPGLPEETTEMMHQLLKELEHTLPTKAWQEFETRFDNVHRGFYEQLHARYPDLTPSELKLCSFLRLNLTTKDIALLTNRSVGTVDNARSSVRKKMGLDNDANLTSFLLSV